MTTDPAGMLTAAAKRLRELAGAVSETGRWYWNIPGQCCPGGYCVEEAGVHGVDHFYRDELTYIATMSPPVALALADLFESEASDAKDFQQWALRVSVDPGGYLDGAREHVRCAVAVARAVIGQPFQQVARDLADIKQDGDET